MHCIHIALSLEVDVYSQWIEEAEERNADDGVRGSNEIIDEEDDRDLRDFVENDEEEADD
jgi:transcription elongation factor Elf1